MSDLHYEAPGSGPPAGGRLGARLAAVVASVVLGSVCLLVIAAPPVSAKGPRGAKEFVPRSYLRDYGKSCVKGGRPWGLRCWRRCPSTHAMLESVDEKDFMRMDADNLVRCVPRRRTRLFYGLKLTARYHSEYGTHPTGFEEVSDHDWTFRPRNAAVMLFRQCTLRSSHDIDLVGDLFDLFEPAIACSRQKRALDPILPRFSLSEDVSLRTAGTLNGGAYVSNFTEDLRETFWWDDDRQRHSTPCLNAATSTTTGNGPTSVPAVLSTPARSSRYNGLQVEPNGGTKTPLTHTGTGRLCPPLPEGARVGLSPTQPFSAATDLFLDRPKGIEILNLFKPHLYEQFGDARIELFDTVEQGIDTAPLQHGTYQRLEVTLELTRCKRQAPPSRCGTGR